MMIGRPPGAGTMARQRHAFTLVELLVVMTIIGMLMALLLPAVQSAREMGRRTSCTSNLYMLALATLRFDEQSGFLPGWRNRGPEPGNSQAVSWPVMLMPNMERNDIYQTWAVGSIQAPYLFEIANAGKPRAQVREWRWNALTSYDFTQGRLAGWTVGGAVRWQDKAAVGYPLLLVESEGDTIQVPNLDNPFTTPASWNGDVFASYKLPLGKRTEWTVRIHLRNYLGDRKFRAEIINPDGSWAAVRIPVQKAFYLSNTIAF
jgi:prepilin-type N-terminal cleavage/methylation domain-containing protein